MAKLLLNLRQVPEDETEEVQDLMTAHDIEHYRTAPSPWGFSAGGIWIRDDSRIAEAKALMAEYQIQRRDRARAEYAQAVADGTVPSFWTRFRQNPLQVMFILLAILFLLSLTTLPYWFLR